MSRRRRLPPARLARIGGWTAVATAGVTALLARFPAGGVPAGAPPAEIVTPTPVVTTATTGATLPTTPAGGLLVLYLSPTPGITVLPATTTTAPVTTAAPQSVTAAAPQSVTAAAPQPVAPPQPVATPPPVTSSGS